MDKRRAGRAPEGSGVPVGTEYHWYILAHQNIAKQTANDYTTTLTGLKFKIAHKRAGSEKWSATPRTQRKHTIAFLRSVLADLRSRAIAKRHQRLQGERQPHVSAATLGRRTPWSSVQRCGAVVRAASRRRLMGAAPIGVRRSWLQRPGRSARHQRSSACYKTCA